MSKFVDENPPTLQRTDFHEIQYDIHSDALHYLLVNFMQVPLNDGAFDDLPTDVIETIRLHQIDNPGRLYLLLPRSIDLNTGYYLVESWTYPEPYDGGPSRPYLRVVAHWGSQPQTPAGLAKIASQWRRLQGVRGLFRRARRHRRN